MKRVLVLTMTCVLTVGLMVGCGKANTHSTASNPTQVTTQSTKDNTDQQTKQELKIQDKQPQAVKEGIYNNIQVVKTTSDKVYVNVNGDIYAFYGDGFSKGDKITIRMTANKEIADAYK